MMNITGIKAIKDNMEIIVIEIRMATKGIAVIKALKDTTDMIVIKSIIDTTAIIDIRAWTSNLLYVHTSV
jgi:hypothetical protein